MARRLVRQNQPALLTMEIDRLNGTLRVARIAALDASHARALRAAVAPQLAPGLHTIELDLSALRGIDGMGLAALASLYQMVLEQNVTVTVRLTNLSPPVQQMIELARLHHLFEIAPPAGQVNGMAA
jgi:anti-anti-sigma factor